MLTRILAHRNLQRPPINSSERINFDTDVSLVISETEDINKALTDLDTAIGEVPLAHAEVRKMLDGTSKSTEALAQLVKEAQRINKFYRTLK